MKFKHAGWVLGVGFCLCIGNGILCSAAEESLAETMPAEEMQEDQILNVEEDVSGDDAAENVTREQTSEKSETGADLDDVKGLIEDDGKQTSQDLSDGLSWDEILEEETEEDQQIRIPGLTVDPSKYPAANITENTSVVYWYLIEELGLNHAAACGVLANVQLESNFRPMALGDSGTSFGICQWHLGRLTNMMSFCNGSGLDYHTLEGQLEYLKLELEGGYKGVYELLLSVEDTPKGAYKAGYGFCMGFEKPDQIVLRSQRRGNLAQNEYFDRTILRPEELELSENRGALAIMREVADTHIKEAAKQADEGPVLKRIKG